jgi:hypothetical protein
MNVPQESWTCSWLWGCGLEGSLALGSLEPGESQPGSAAGHLQTHAAPRSSTRSNQNARAGQALPGRAAGVVRQGRAQAAAPPADPPAPGCCCCPARRPPRGPRCGQGAAGDRRGERDAGRPPTAAWLPALGCLLPRPPAPARGWPPGRVLAAAESLPLHGPPAPQGAAATSCLRFCGLLQVGLATPCWLAGLAPAKPGSMVQQPRASPALARYMMLQALERQSAAATAAVAASCGADAGPADDVKVVEGVLPAADLSRRLPAGVPAGPQLPR